MTHASPAVHRLKIRDASLLRGDAREPFLADARAAIAGGAHALVIDLGGGVELDDPREVVALVTLRRHVPPHVRVALASLTPGAQRVARATHLHDLFDIYADARYAVDDLSSEAGGGGSVRAGG